MIQVDRPRCRMIQVDRVRHGDVQVRYFGMVLMRRGYVRSEHIAK